MGHRYKYSKRRVRKTKHRKTHKKNKKNKKKKRTLRKGIAGLRITQPLQPIPGKPDYVDILINIVELQDDIEERFRRLYEDLPIGWDGSTKYTDGKIYYYRHPVPGGADAVVSDAVEEDSVD